MDVTVEESKFSFAVEYDITAPGRSFHARKKILSLVDHLTLTSDDGNTLAQIDGEFSPLRSRHDIQLSDGRLYKFLCEKIWTGVYVCEGEDRTYRLYTHKGLKFSIFLNDEQIAAFEKNRVVIGNGNRYIVRMNSDADLLLVVCMVLTINSSDDTNDNSSVTIDFGKIGPEGRPYDESWQPH